MNMSKTLFDEAGRQEMIGRIARVQSGAKPLWGKMNAEQMLAHLSESMRMTLGELPTKSKRLPIRYWPLKQLIIYVFPFPKGTPTAPELLPAESGTVEQRRAELNASIARLAARREDEPFPEHPAFGKLSRRAWGVLAYRHLDHHLRQFGV